MRSATIGESRIERRAMKNKEGVAASVAAKRCHFDDLIQEYRLHSAASALAASRCGAVHRIMKIRKRACDRTRRAPVKGHA